MEVHGRNWLPWIPLAIGAALAGCGGSAGSTGVVHTATAAATAAPAGQLVPVSITVQFAQTAATARKAKYVGAGTQAVTVAVNSASPVPFACSAQSCPLTISAPTGTDTFTVNAYDGPSLSASPAPLLISSGTATATVAVNAANAVTLNLGALIAGGALTLTAVNPLPLVGTASQTSLQMTAGSMTDPDGNTIPSSALLAPLTIQPSPASSHVTVSPSTITSATTPVTVSYDGAASGTVTLTVVQTATGNTVSSTSAPLQIVPHAYFVFVPTNKTGCPTTSSDCLQIWSPILNKVVGTAAVGNGANDVAVNAGLTQAFVPNGGDGTISVLNISNKTAPTVTATIGGGALTSASGIGYDTTHGRNVLYTGSVTPLAPPSRMLSIPPSGGTATTLVTGYTYLGGAILDPTGSCLYNYVYGQNQMGIGDNTGFDTYDLVNSIDRGFTSHTNTGALVVAPDGSAVYALQVPPSPVTKYPVTNPGCSVGGGTVVTPGLGNGKAIVLTRDGSTLYVGGAGGNPALAQIATGSFTITNQYNIGSGTPMFAMAISPDSRYIFALDNYGGGSFLARLRVVDLQASGGPAEISGSPFFSWANNVRAYP